MLNHRPPLVRSQLPQLESIVLWTIRAWVIGYCRRVNVASRIETVFAQIGMPEGGAQLDRFMSALGNGVRRTLEVNCVCCQQVSADEAALLQVFTLQQEYAPEETYAILARLVTETAAAACYDSARRLAIGFQEAGHMFCHFTTTGSCPGLANAPDPLEKSLPKYLH